MLEGPVNVGKKYIWNPPGDNTYNLEVVPMAVLTVLAIHSYTITNRTWIEFKDDQGNRTSMDAARFRQGCLETNKNIEENVMSTSDVPIDEDRGDVDIRLLDFYLADKDDNN